MPTPQEPYVTHSLHRNPELSHNHGLDLSLNSSLTVRSYNICIDRQSCHSTLLRAVLSFKSREQPI